MRILHEAYQFLVRKYLKYGNAEEDENRAISALDVMNQVREAT